LSIDGVALHWEYNVMCKRCEAIASGWRAVVARWANGAEWTATVESLSGPEIQYAAEQVFSWV
jgi:hypothetical protein